MVKVHRIILTFILLLIGLGLSQNRKVETDTLKARAAFKIRLSGTWYDRTSFFGFLNGSNQLGLSGIADNAVNSAKIVDASVANADILDPSISISAGDGLYGAPGSIDLGETMLLQVNVDDTTIKIVNDTLHSVTDTSAIENIINNMDLSGIVELNPYNIISDSAGLKVNYDTSYFKLKSIENINFWLSKNGGVFRDLINHPFAQGVNNDTIFHSMPQCSVVTGYIDSWGASGGETLYIFNKAGDSQNFNLTTDSTRFAVSGILFDNADSVYIYSAGTVFIDNLYLEIQRQLSIKDSSIGFDNLTAQAQDSATGWKQTLASTSGLYSYTDSKTIKVASLGDFERIDSTYTEAYGGIVFNSINSGEQWVLIDWLKHPGIVYASWWGVSGYDTDDDSLGVQSAYNFAANVGASTAPPTVVLPPGEIYLHEMQMQQVLLRGDEVRSTTIYYNGVGGTGTYLFKKSSGMMSYWGFENLAIIGLSKAQDVLCEYILYFNNAGADWGFKLDNVFLNGAIEDLLRMDNGYVNLYLNRSRFGFSGGYCINITAPTGMENRPFSMEDFTWDNAIASGIHTLLQSYGAGNGSDAGKGFLKITDTGGAGGVFIDIKDGRIENNDPLASPYSLFDLVSTSGNPISINLTNVVGYGNGTTIPSLIRAFSSGTIKYKLDQVIFDNVMGIEFTSASVANVQARSFSYGNYTLGIGTGSTGLFHPFFLNGKKIEISDATPTNSNFYRQGDWILNADTDSLDNLGWIVTAPDTGMVRANTLTWSNGAMQNGEDTLTIAISKTMFPGVAVIVPGAGAGGTDLQAVILKVDRSEPGYILDKTAGTTVSGVTISQPSLTWTKFGIIGQTQAASVDTSGSGNNYINQIVQSLKNAGIMQ